MVINYLNYNFDDCHVFLSLILISLIPSYLSIAHWSLNGEDWLLCGDEAELFFLKGSLQAFSQIVLKHGFIDHGLILRANLQSYGEFVSFAHSKVQVLPYIFLIWFQLTVFFGKNAVKILLESSDTLDFSIQKKDLISNLR